MSRFAKMLWIWMLVLVLPAQAIASASKGLCNPSHRVMASFQHGQRLAHSVDGTMQALFVEQTAIAACDKASFGAGQLQATSIGDGMTCSASTVCCAASAMPLAPSPWAPTLGHVGRVGDGPIFLFASIVLAAPEHPPRLG